MWTKDFGYMFEKPAFIKAMEKQQRIIDNMMRPYKELSVMYSGMNTLLTSLQARGIFQCVYGVSFCIKSSISRRANIF